METTGNLWELITADEPAIVTEALLDVVAVENVEGSGRLTNSTGTNEGDWSEGFCETDDLLD